LPCFCVEASPYGNGRDGYKTVTVGKPVMEKGFNKVDNEMKLYGGNYLFNAFMKVAADG